MSYFSMLNGDLHSFGDQVAGMFQRVESDTKRYAVLQHKCKKLKELVKLLQFWKILPLKNLLEQRLKVDIHDVCIELLNNILRTKTKNRTLEL